MSTSEVVQALQSLQSSLGAGGARSRTTSTSSVTATIKRQERVVVHIKLIFIRVGDVDTVKQQFEADIFIKAQWREPEWDGKDIPGDDFDWNKHWLPKLHILNVIGDPKQEGWCGAFMDDQRKGWAFQKRRVKGIFAETMELDTFPFDLQCLTVRITSDRSTDEISLEADPSELSIVRVQSFKDQQEWHLMSHVDTWTHQGMSQMERRHRHPVFHAACRVQRRVGYFIWNIFLVLMIITSLAFTSFAVNNATIQNRLLLTFTALLTTVAFKQIANRNVPRVSYLTYMDQYILTSITLLTIIAVWHCIVKQLTYNVELAATADLIAVCILGGLYLLFQASFFLHVYFMARKERKEHTMKDVQHEETMKKERGETPKEKSYG